MPSLTEFEAGGNLFDRGIATVINAGYVSFDYEGRFDPDLFARWEVIPEDQDEWSDNNTFHYNEKTGLWATYLHWKVDKLTNWLPTLDGENPTINVDPANVTLDLIKSTVAHLTEDETFGYDVIPVLNSRGNPKRTAFLENTNFVFFCETSIQQAKNGGQWITDCGDTSDGRAFVGIRAEWARVQPPTRGDTKSRPVPVMTEYLGKDEGASVPSSAPSAPSTAVKGKGRGKAGSSTTSKGKASGAPSKGKGKGVKDKTSGKPTGKVTKTPTWQPSDEYLTTMAGLIRDELDSDPEAYVDIPIDGEDGIIARLMNPADLGGNFTDDIERAQSVMHWKAAVELIPGVEIDDDAKVITVTDGDAFAA